MYQAEERVELASVRTVARVLNDTFELIRLDFRLFLRALAAIALVPAGIGSALFSYGYYLVMSPVIMGNSNAFGAPVPGFDVAVGGYLILAGILLWIGYSLLILTVHELVAMHGRMTREEMKEVRVREIWDRVRPRIWSMLGSTIVWMIGLSLFAFVILIPIVGIFAFYALVVFILFYFTLRIYDGRGLLQSFIVSANLVGGAWAKTVGLVILLSIVSVALTGVFIFPAILAGILNGFGVFDIEGFLDSNAGPLIGILYFLVYGLGSFLFTSVSIVAVILHFFSRIEQKERRSLMEEVETIGAA